MPVIPLVSSDSPTLISSVLRLSAHHLALAALASQPLKSGTLSLYLSVPDAPILTPSVVISRPTTAGRSSTPLNPSPLAPQIRLCWPLCAFINYIYLLTYLVTYIFGIGLLFYIDAIIRWSLTVKVIWYDVRRNSMNFMPYSVILGYHVC